MSLKAGIIGLPNVGKSTLYNAITNSQVEAANYPFATIQPNVSIVNVLDKRLDKLVEMINPKKICYATFKFIDIAGLVKGAYKGEGLGNKFLGNIKDADAIVQVVRCFKDKNIIHVEGNVDPINDMAIINLELILSDMQIVQNFLKRVEKKALATKDKTLMFELEIAKKLKEALALEKPARKLTWTKKELKVLKSFNLLTLKPIIYVGNVDEEFVSNPEDSPLFKKMQKEATRQGAASLGISAKIESEIANLEEEEKEMFLKDLNIDSSGLSKLVRETFSLLNLATYFTAGIEEVKAWTFVKGMLAPQCAGIIHTDFEKGFIKAQIISYDDYVQEGGEQGAKDAGKSRLEGKTYIMQDADICHFKFNN